MTDTHLISVLVPVFNAEKYISCCIESVLKQRYSKLELILVDDGSTDRSGEICEEYAEQDSRLRVIHTPNGGQLRARSCALENATGDYCVFLDADDSLAENALEVLTEEFLRNGCDCVVYGFVKVQDGKVRFRTEDELEECFEDKRRIFRRILFSDQYNSVCRKAIKRELISGMDISRFYGVRYGEDLLQSLAMLKKCRRVSFINDRLYNYTLNPDSVTQTRKYENYTVDFTLREAVLDFLREEDVFSEADYTEFRTHSMELFIDKLKTICRLETNVANRCRLLEDMRNASYYKGFLLNGDIHRKKIGMKMLLLFVFQRGWDALLIRLIECYDIAKNVTRKVLYR